MGRAATFLAVAGLIGLAQAAPAQEPDPEVLADILSGDAARAASANPQCRFFTPDEIAAYLGEPVAAGANAGMGMGCQWLATDSDGDAMVTVVPAEYAEHPSLAPGFREAPEIGTDGFVVPEFDGWAAGATSGDSFVKVSVAGAGASEDKALDLLRETLARLGG